MTDAHPHSHEDPQFALEQTYLLAARQGDYEAFDALFALLSPALRRFAVRLIGPRDDVDDILQITAINLYRNLPRIDPPGNLRPYVYRMVRNRCYDLLRSGRREVASLDDEPMELWVSFTEAEGTVATEDAAYWLLLHLEVREAIDRLPEAQRQALILFAEEGFSYSEIAEIAQVSIGTIKSRLYHAKRGLRQRLRPETLALLDSEFAGESAPDDDDDRHGGRHEEGNDDGRYADQAGRTGADGGARAGKVSRKDVSQRDDQRHRRSGRAQLSAASRPAGGAAVG